MIKDNWYCCPVCGNKVQKLSTTSTIYNTPLYCKKCKTESMPTIYSGHENTLKSGLAPAT